MLDQRDSVFKKRKISVTLRRAPQTRSPLVATRCFLVSDEVRKEISEECEKSQPRDAVGG
jgi:hypothetical protein